MIVIEFDNDDINNKIYATNSTKKVHLYETLSNKLIEEIIVDESRIASNTVYLNITQELKYNTEYHYVFDEGVVESNTKDPNSEFTGRFITPIKKELELVDVEGTEHSGMDDYIFTACTVELGGRYTKLDDFKIGKYEVTTIQFIQFLKLNPSGPKQASDSNNYKVVRGGSYYTGEAVVGIYIRSYMENDLIDGKGNIIGIWTGFRVAKY